MNCTKCNAAGPLELYNSIFLGGTQVCPQCARNEHKQVQADLDACAPVMPVMILSEL